MARATVHFFRRDTVQAFDQLLYRQSQAVFKRPADEQLSEHRTTGDRRATPISLEPGRSDLALQNSQIQNQKRPSPWRAGMAGYVRRFSPRVTKPMK